MYNFLQGGGRASLLLQGRADPCLSPRAHPCPRCCCCIWYVTAAAICAVVAAGASAYDSEAAPAAAVRLHLIPLLQHCPVRPLTPLFAAAFISRSCCSLYTRCARVPLLSALAAPASHPTADAATGLGCLLSRVSMLGRVCQLAHQLRQGLQWCTLGAEKQHLQCTAPIGSKACCLFRPC